MSRSVYRYNVSLCYLCVSLTVSVVSVKRQEVTETAKSVTETSRTYRNFTMAVLYCIPNMDETVIRKKPTAAAVLFTKSYLEIARSQFMIKY